MKPLFLDVELLELVSPKCLSFYNFLGLRTSMLYFSMIMYHLENMTSLSFLAGFFFLIAKQNGINQKFYN